MRAQLGITLGLIACCAVFCALGYWQVTRAEEKRLIETQLAASLTSAPEAFSKDSKPFSRVRVRGRYDPSHLFFIDNRIHLGQPGVEVVQAFQSTSGQRLLIDRGWMGVPDRLFPITPPDSPVNEEEIVGLLLPDFGVGFTLQSSQPSLVRPAGPMLIQQFDLKFISGLANTEPKYVLRLRGGEPGALTTEPFSLPMGSQRHLAYAVQWFGLAVASIIIWLYLARKHLTKRSKSDG